jgi:hypothetical protein
VELPVEGLFWSVVHLHGGQAPVRRSLPELIDLIWNRQIDPGKVFDLTLSLDQAADGYEAMDQRRAIKTSATSISHAPSQMVTTSTADPKTDPERSSTESPPVVRDRHLRWWWRPEQRRWTLSNQRERPFGG